MTVIAAGLLIVTLAATAGAVSGGCAPARIRPLLVGLLTALSGAGGITAGAAALSGQSWSIRLPGLLPLGSAELSVDPLSGAFLVIIGAVAVAAGGYSVGYTAPGGCHPADDTASADHAAHDAGGAASRTCQATLPLFVASMLLVPAAASVTTLLLMWELMALTSLVLVLAEHRSRRSVRDAALWYAGMTHVGLAAILIGLVLFAGGVGGESFVSLREGADALSPGLRAAIFGLTLLGFGSKAGMIPLHVWLPRAHAESPSHVSALMSAAMVNLGVYGVIRVSFDLLGGGPRWWGVVVLAFGCLSATYGVLQATVATDLKRLLGYSTSENVGLMLIGIGAAGIFAADGNRPLAGLLLAAAMLHAANHAAFKALLFLGAGSVLRATGLRDLDRLGGLAARMPATTAMVGFAALAAAALPPGNGFVSEWLLLQGLIHSLTLGGTPPVIVAVTMPLAVAVVALTAGLGAAAFVKAFAVGFLARPRSDAAASATEGPWPMRAAMGSMLLVCLVLGLAPALAGGSLTRILATLPTVRDGAPLAGSGVTLHLAGIAGSMSPLLIAAGLLGAAAGVVVLVRWVGARRPRRVALVWGCGGIRLDPRMEYTATSFAEPLMRVFDDVLRPEHDVTVTPYAESRYLVESVQFRQRVPDRVEARIYPPLLAAGAWWGDRFRAVANGSVHRYLAYGFFGFVAVLIVVGLTA